MDRRGSAPCCKLHQFPAKEVAMELTLRDGEAVRKIAPSEITNGAWMDKNKKHELAPNVLAMVQAFNRLALLVPTEILEERTPQARAKVITAFIQIASKCHSLRNYNSLKAILAGLQCTPIFRLERTWKEVPSKRRKCFKHLSALVSEEDNWKTYREELWQNYNLGYPCIPFLGVFLTTLVQKESYDKMKPTSPGDANCGSMYTILEAITVRHRLEKLTHNRSFDIPFSSSSESEDESEAGIDMPPSRSIHRRLMMTASKASDTHYKTTKVITPQSASSNEFSIGDDSTVFHTHNHVCGSSQNGICKIVEAPENLAGANFSTDLPPLQHSRLGVPNSHETQTVRPVQLSGAERRKLFSREKTISTTDVLDAIQDAHSAAPVIRIKHSSSLTNIHSFNGTDDLSDRNPRRYDPTEALNFAEFAPTRYTTSCATGTGDDTTSVRTRRQRSCTPHVPRLQVARMDTCSLSPNDMLAKLQFVSLGCCVGEETNHDIRDVLTASTSNSEAINYKLSYEREPE